MSEDEYCDQCVNQWDDGAPAHFKRCRVYSVCTGCDPYICNGEDFKKSEGKEDENMDNEG